MKKLLLTLIVSLALCGSIFAQVQYESHWPDFYYPDYMSQTPCVAVIAIDGEIVTAENHPDNWDALEVAFFVGDQCRGAGVEFGIYNPSVNYLYNGYVEEWGDPYPIIDGAPVYYDNQGEEVTVKMYDHVNNIEYNECIITYLGDPYVILTGADNDQGWADPETIIMLNFIPSASDCKIRVSVDEPWVEDFEGYDITTTEAWTGEFPECWTLAAQYTGTDDTLPQIYRNFNSTDEGQYSLRMHFRSLLAMPELDESVDLSKVRLSMYVRQPYYKYKLQIGVITDMDNPDESFVPVAVINNPDKNVTYFECGFHSVANLAGAGRYIAFKNIGGSEGDLYCTNYLDDITLTYVGDECVLTDLDMPHTESFEGYTDLAGATGVEPDCWELIAEDVDLESTTKPQLYQGFNTSADGAYTLRMRNRCIYAMPKIQLGAEASVDVMMTLKVRQPNALYRLQVGLVDEEDNFTPVKTIACTTTEMEEFIVNFSDFGSGRIAFRNTLVPGAGMATDYFDYSYNYIDDITVDVVTPSKSDENVSEETEANIDNIVVYPNPTTGELHIDAVEVQKVECYNAMGQLVSVYNNVRNIDLGSLSDGVYTLRITVPQGVTMRKIVKR